MGLLSVGIPEMKTRRGGARWPRIKPLISSGGGWCQIKSLHEVGCGIAESRYVALKSIGHYHIQRSTRYLTVFLIRIVICHS